MVCRNLKVFINRQILIFVNIGGCSRRLARHSRKNLITHHLMCVPRKIFSVRAN